MGLIKNTKDFLNSNMQELGINKLDHFIKII